VYLFGNVVDVFVNIFLTKNTLKLYFCFLISLNQTHLKPSKK
jgi:hypothetical protein